MTTWIFALLGLAMAAAGGGAIVMGWPLVPLERGWTMVIAGSAFGSAGIVCLALASLIGETRRARRAIERFLGAGASAMPVEAVAAPIAPTSSVAQTRTLAHSAIATGEAAMAPAVGDGQALDVSAAETVAADEFEARSFTVGDTTFVVFSNGSIEARTAQGARRFASMQEVRAYLEGLPQEEAR